MTGGKRGEDGKDGYVRKQLHWCAVDIQTGTLCFISGPLVLQQSINPFNRDIKHCL